MNLLRELARKLSALADEADALDLTSLPETVAALRLQPNNGGRMIELNLWIDDDGLRPSWSVYANSTHHKGKTCAEAAAKWREASAPPVEVSVESVVADLRGTTVEAVIQEQYDPLVARPF